MPIPAAAVADAFHDLPLAPLVVGFSGGLDSTVLLHALARGAHRAETTLRAVHVHHGLHPDADDWARHCQQACQAVGVPLQVIRVQVQARGQGPEGAAREARLDALAGSMHPGDVLALGHHRDDQAETFLLRALRASGVEGLAAMRRWRDFGPGRLWRPLLDTPRQALMAYARDRGLAWIEDPSNASDDFDRNFLRNQVLPLLATRWPHSTGALARSAALCAQAADLLAADDQQMLAALSDGRADTLQRAALLGLPMDRRARLLRHWTVSLGLPALPAGGVERIERELLQARPDAVPEYRWHGAWVRAWRDRLFAGRERPPLPPGWSTAWDGMDAVALPGGDRLELWPSASPTVPRPMRVHARSGGERIHLPGRAHSHSLKHVLQHAGIPPWERGRLPLLSDPGGALLAAGDRIIAAPFADWLSHHGLQLHWRRN